MKTSTSRVVRPIVAIAMGAALGSLTILLPAFRTAPTPAPVIAFVPRTSGTNFTEDMHHGAEAAAKSAGYQIYWNAPTRGDDVDRQIAIAERAVNKGAKALVLGPTNPWGVTTMLNEFESRKVPVVVVQTELPMPTGPYLTSVTPDQVQFGRIAASRIVQITGGAGEVAIVGLDRGTPETLVRAKSFIEAMKAYPGIEVVAQAPGSVQTLEAEQSAREVIGEFPLLKAVFAVSANATEGVMVAIENMNPKPLILLVGCDRDLFLVDGVLQGRIDSLVTADPYETGYEAVHAALVGAGGHLLPPPLHMKAELLTRQNYAQIENH